MLLLPSLPSKTALNSTSLSMLQPQNGITGRLYEGMAILKLVLYVDFLFYVITSPSSTMFKNLLCNLYDYIYLQ